MLAQKYSFDVCQNVHCESKMTQFFHVQSNGIKSAQASAGARAARSALITARRLNKRYLFTQLRLLHVHKRPLFTFTSTLNMEFKVTSKVG